MTCIKPDGDVIYLLDNLGTSITCTKDDQNRYVCSNVIYGKVPIFDTSKNNCSWKLCNVDINTNKIDFDNCRDTTYKYYSQQDGKGCKLTDYTKGEISSIDKDCCCNPDSICDYENCCDRVPIDQCPLQDFQNNFFNIGYLENDQNSYVCMDSGGNKICARTPADYNKNPEWYPKIQEAAKNGLYSSSLCDCVKDDTACEKNSQNCQSKPECIPCNPEQVPGDYTCEKGICKKTENGEYKDISTCQQNCGEIGRYDCIEGKCMENESGDYYSLKSCQNACDKVVSNPSKYDRKKIVQNIIIFISAVFILIILFLIFIYVFSLVKRKIQNNKFKN